MLPTSAPLARSPLDHFNVLDDDPCGCAVCAPWFHGRTVVEHAVAERPNHMPTCNCPACQPARAARFQFQAINTRRDLWIEMSFHASLHKYGQSYMEWLAKELTDRERSAGWWANEASRHPLGFWFERFDLAVRTGSVSITGAITGVFSFVTYYLDQTPENEGLGSISSLLVGIEEVGEVAQFVDEHENLPGWTELHATHNQARGKNFARTSGIGPFGLTRIK